MKTSAAFYKRGELRPGMVFLTQNTNSRYTMVFLVIGVYTRGIMTTVHYFHVDRTGQYRTSIYPGTSDANTWSRDQQLC